MADISNDADQIDVRNITDRVEELRTELSDAHDDAEENDILDMRTELTTLESLLKALRGNGGDHKWEGVWYPSSLIRDDYFEDAMRELVEDIGDLPQGIPSYLVVNWEATASNLKADYSSVEYDGVTYWYR